MMRAFLSAILTLMAMRVVDAAGADLCPAELGYKINGALGCVTECSPGYHVPVAGQACEMIAAGNIYTDTTHTVKYGETSGDNVKKCPAGADGVRGMTNPRESDPANSIRRCYRIVDGVRYTATDRGSCVVVNDTSCIVVETHGVLKGACFYTTGPDGAAIYDQRTIDPATGERSMHCVPTTNLTSCDAGWYDPRNGGASTDNVPRLNPCQPVGTEYYSPDGDLNRYPCPAGTATCGWGECAKSSADCKPYKTLKTSTGVSLILQPEKRTSPTLVVRMPDESLWYGQTEVNARPGHINIGYNNAQYSLVNPLDFFTEIISAGDKYLVPIKAALPY